MVSEWSKRILKEFFVVAINQTETTIFKFQNIFFDALPYFLRCMKENVEIVLLSVADFEAVKMAAGIVNLSEQIPKVVVLLHLLEDVVQALLADAVVELPLVAVHGNAVQHLVQIFVVDNHGG